MIIILGLPDTGSNDHLDIEDDSLGESREAATTSLAFQMISPPVQVGSRSGKSKFTRTRLKRLPLLY